MTSGKLGVSALLYLSLIFSSSLQFTLGPEAVLRAASFHVEAPEARDTEFRAAHPDFGALAHDETAKRVLKAAPSWTFTSFWGDAGYYAQQASAVHESIAPYKYRVLAPALAHGLLRVTGLSVERAFVVLNAAACLVTALAFEVFLSAYFGFAAVTAVLGSCLFVTCASNAGTLPFPMLEPVSLMFSCLILMSVAYGRSAFFVVTALLGVATKEVLAISALLWLLAAPEPKLWKRAAVAAVPLLGFVVLRLALGGSALEVNYGYNMLDGQFPAYGKRLLQWRSIAGVTLQVFLAFSFMWLGLWQALKQPFLRRCLPIVPVTVIAAILLSSRLTRTLGILFPIVVPGFLLWFDTSPLRTQGLTVLQSITKKS
ncbi:MAG: hypothetical protein RL701_473 [Pseudomonadota bacterium]